MKAVAAVGLVLVALGSAACNVARSDLVSMGPTYEPAGVACSSTLGSYALPMAQLRVRVVQTDNGPPELEAPVAGTDSPIEVVRRPDPNLTFCLDHLNSVLSKDTITVRKTEQGKDKGSPYLFAVLVNATDQTSVILQALARTALVFVSGSHGFRGATGVKKILADLEFDPLDHVQTTRVNRALRQHGFCVVLDDYTAASGEIDRYCNAPDDRRPTELMLRYREAQNTRVDPHGAGLFYRPRQSFSATVYQRKDPRGRGGWNIAARKIVQLENLSPVLSLDITRAAFAGKQVNFAFDSGVLTVACVSKASEVLGALDVPLAISRSLVELPTTIIQVQIDQTKKSAALVQAETQLLALQKAQLAALQTGAYSSTYSKSSEYAGVPVAFSADYSKSNLALDDNAKAAGFLLPPSAKPCPGASG